MEVDIVTLQPKEYSSDDERKKKDAEYLDLQISNGLLAHEQLKSEHGKVFVTSITEALKKRMLELSEPDPQIQTLLGLLGQYGNLIIMAEAASKRLAASRLGISEKELETP